MLYVIVFIVIVAAVIITVVITTNTNIMTNKNVSELNNRTIEWKEYYDCNGNESQPGTSKSDYRLNKNFICLTQCLQCLVYDINNSTMSNVFCARRLF